MSRPPSASRDYDTLRAQLNKLQRLCQCAPAAVRDATAWCNLDRLHFEAAWNGITNDEIAGRCIEQLQCYLTLVDAASDAARAARSALDHMADLYNNMRLSPQNGMDILTALRMTTVSTLKTACAEVSESILSTLASPAWRALSPTPELLAAVCSALYEIGIGARLFDIAWNTRPFPRTENKPDEYHVAMAIYDHIITPCSVTHRRPIASNTHLTVLACRDAAVSSLEQDRITNTLRRDVEIAFAEPITMADINSVLLRFHALARQNMLLARASVPSRSSQMSSADLLRQQVLW